MIDWSYSLAHGGVFALWFSVFALLSLRFYPRIFLQDFPEDVQTAVPPKTPREQQLTALWLLLFLLLIFGFTYTSTRLFQQAHPAQNSFWPLFWHAFIVMEVANAVDWLILDWLLLRTIHPAWVLIPGTQGMPGYRAKKEFVKDALGFFPIGSGFAALIAWGITAVLLM